MQLFELIHSMTRSEKRYLKLFAGFHEGDKQYLRLFDLIAAQEEYDEKAIRAALAGERLGRQLHVARHYLYNLILKSLRAYRASTSIDARIQAHILDARILHAKGLIADCADALRKGRELAEAHERIPYLLEILDLEGNYLDERKDSDDAIATLLAEKRAQLERLENLFELDALSDRISARLFRGGKPRDEGAMRRIDEMLEHPLLADEKKALTRRALARYYYIHSGYHFARNEQEKAADFTRRRLHLYESAPEEIAANIGEYSSALVNLLVLRDASEAERKEAGEMFATLKSLPDLARRHGVADERLFYTIFNFGHGIEMGYMIECGEFAKGAALIPEIEAGIRTYRAYITDVDLLRFNFLIATTLFGLRRYAEALEYINRAIALRSVEYRQHVYESALLLDLIIHYELGNLTLIEHRVKSVYRHLRSRGSLGQAETILLRYIRKLPGLRTRGEVTESFRRLYAELEPLASDPHEQHAFANFDFPAWLRSKIRGTTFAEEVTPA